MDLDEHAASGIGFRARNVAGCLHCVCGIRNSQAQVNILHIV
jgi:hypothetical protein